jgi:Protein of unknown function (DUF3891)
VIALGATPTYSALSKGTAAMIIQTAPQGSAQLIIMMHEHNALCQQLAYAFGNGEFESLSPLHPMIFVISHHDAGWREFDVTPAIDERTGLPYNLAETPARYITVTSRLSPDFNERQHAYCGFISSMHSWGLYNGRYGLSDLVLLDKIKEEDRSLTDKMLADELARQERLRAVLAKDPQTSAWLDEAKIFQNYKQLQFIDLLALYFNRVHPSERKEQKFEHVPMAADHDATVTIKPAGDNVYALSPFPFANERAEFAFGGRFAAHPQGNWPLALKQAPTSWERFRLIAG